MGRNSGIKSKLEKIGFILTSVVIVLMFLSVSVSSSGVVSNSDSQSAMFNQNQGKSYVFSFDGIEMRMTVNSNAYKVSYIQNGQKIFIQAKELRLGVVSYSLNNGIWRTVDVSSQVSPAVVTPPPGGGGGSNSNSNNLWWDGIYFVQNYPHLYPHPDVSYYQIYTQYNSYLIGNQLVHYQMGSFFVSTIATIGPIGIGAAIGALIGAMVGGSTWCSSWRRDWSHNRCGTSLCRACDIC